jgi:hypothetical protein
MANIKYVSSEGVEFNLLNFDYAKLYKADFHNVSWQPETISKQYGTVLNRWTKDAQQFSCTFRFKGSYEKRKTQIDNFIFQTERDIARKTPGRIYWNEQYIDCFFNSHDTAPVDDGQNWTEITGTFYAPYPFWILEQTLIIRPSEASTSGLPENVKGYPEDREFVYGYEYAYPYARNAIYIDVDSPLESDFKAVIYGPATKAQFNIAGHNYEVDYPLRYGQVMIIDSRDQTPTSKKCYVISSNGSETNVFNYRVPNSLLFKKIPSGNVVLNYTRNFGIDLTIFQERSAPN